LWRSSKTNLPPWPVFTQTEPCYTFLQVLESTSAKVSAEKAAVIGVENRGRMASEEDRQRQAESMAQLLETQLASRDKEQAAIMTEVT